METFNVYCDESCHLEFDKSPIMTLGAVWFNIDKTREITDRVNSIKEKYGVTKFRELKWTKLSPALYECYEALINYFFDDDDLHFRVLVVDNKQYYDHQKNSSYDEWYFKMYFQTLRGLIDPESKYNIYIDIKDTCSKKRIDKLQEVICNSIYDFDHKKVQKIQAVRSESIAVMQIVDILTGALSYYCRDIRTSESKNKLIQLIKHRSGYNLKKTTLYRESKFNIFHLQLEE